VISYITRRLLWIIPVMFTVSIITFTLMHSVPGGPWDREKRLPASVEKRLNAEYGLDQPLYVQYVSWATGFIQGDLGPSYRYQDRRVNDLIADGLMTTVQLGLMAFALSVIVGIPLGIFAALGHNRGPDYASTSLSIIGIATGAVRAQEDGGPLPFTVSVGGTAATHKKGKKEEKNRTHSGHTLNQNKSNNNKTDKVKENRDLIKIP
jgi:ABC-type microcin C transport system permease subunit YejB